MRSWSLFAAACAVVFTVACGQTDAGITSTVKSKLAADDAVKAYQVDVDTRDHIVTLSGTVDSVAAKERAVLLARGTDGVSDVVDNIRLSDAVATSGINESAREAARDAGATVSDDGKRVGEAAKDGADAVADGARKVGSEVKKGAKKVGSEVKDVFTDDDPDTNKDGK